MAFAEETMFMERLPFIVLFSVDTMVGVEERPCPVTPPTGLSSVDVRSEASPRSFP